MNDSPVSNPPLLSTWRRWVQILAFLVTVYGGVVVGFYQAEKITGQLPALSCSFDTLNGAYCTLIPFQHQTHRQVGEKLAKGMPLELELLKPLGLTLLGFLAYFLVLNKAFCGWICPLGTLQEGLFRLGRRLGLVFRRLTPTVQPQVRMGKWILLLGFVFLLPLLTGLGVLPPAFGDAYCRLCPSRIATTLLTGNPEQLAIGARDWSEWALGWAGNLLFGLMVMTALVARQPFCRICPMLALHALFRRLSPLRLSKPSRTTCGSCTACARACPMEIHEIASREGPAAFHEDCTLCGRCAEFCPRPGQIQLKWGPWAWFSSHPDYARRRGRVETPEGEPRARRASPAHTEDLPHG